LAGTPPLSGRTCRRSAEFRVRRSAWGYYHVLELLAL
jgi:hypothetical protein